MNAPLFPYSGQKPMPAPVPHAHSPAEDAFLGELGDRVRQLRAHNNLSRKALAQESGLSERYIAQMEAGKGNVSVILLRRICAATNTRLEDLIGEAALPEEWLRLREALATATPAQIEQALAVLSPDRSSATQVIGAHRIALIGLRGAGKSTLGQMAARRLGWPFVELNREIERDHGLPVTELFPMYGQDGYRRLEQTSLKGLIARSGPMLLATNGGLVSEPQTFELLLANYVTIWVKAQPQEHMIRVRKQGDVRPAADDRAAMGELRTILARREAAYSRAQYVLDTSGRTVEASLDDLLKIVRLHEAGDRVGMRRAAGVA